MKPNESNPLHDLLGDLFPKGEVPDPDGKGVTEEKGKPDPMACTPEEIEAAIAKGPRGIEELMMEKLKAMAQQQGISLAEVEVTKDGVTIRKAGNEVKLDPFEVMQLHRIMGGIIQDQVGKAKALAAMQVYRKMLGLDD